jgi:hypothetical protein
LENRVERCDELCSVNEKLFIESLVDKFLEKNNKEPSSLVENTGEVKWEKKIDKDAALTATVL